MIKKILNEIFYNRSIRFKIISVMLLIALPIMISNFFTISSSNNLIIQLNEYNDLYITAVNLKETSEEADINLKEFLITTEDSYYFKFNENIESFDSTLNILYEELNDNPNANLILRSINNARNSYTTLAEEAIDNRITGGQTYLNTYYKAETINSFLERYTEELLGEILTSTSLLESQLEAESVRNQQINIVFLVSVILISIFSSIIFSNYITKHINSIVYLASELGKGNFEIEGNISTSKDELGEMGRSFDKMSQRMQNMINDLEKNHALNDALKEEEIKNAKIQESLKEAKFLALRSQINPHFLFNTLNIISRTAMFENANKTDELINSLSEILRYNLRHDSKTTTLDKELEVTRQYINIQKHRFSDRMDFKIEIEDNMNINNIIIPSFTLQPIVENAIKHGIEPKVDGGTVWIKLSDQKDFYEISIEDDGIGMDTDKLNNIKQQNNASSIGIKNIIERLTIFQNREDCFDIISAEGIGTKFIVRIFK